MMGLSGAWDRGVDYTGHAGGAWDSTGHAGWDRGVDYRSCWCAFFYVQWVTDNQSKQGSDPALETGVLYGKGRIQQYKDEITSIEGKIEEEEKIILKQGELG